MNKATALKVKIGDMVATKADQRTPTMYGTPMEVLAYDEHSESFAVNYPYSKFNNWLVTPYYKNAKNDARLRIIEGVYVKHKDVALLTPEMQESSLLAHAKQKYEIKKGSLWSSFNSACYLHGYGVQQALSTHIRKFFSPDVCYVDRVYSGARGMEFARNEDIAVTVRMPLSLMVTAIEAVLFNGEPQEWNFPSEDAAIEELKNSVPHCIALSEFEKARDEYKEIASRNGVEIEE